jgi:hypothetical protein
MAITATLGATINNAIATNVLTFGSNVCTVGQVIVFCVAILTPSVTVLSITDTTNPATFQGAINNGSNVRIELWTTTITTTTSARTFVVALSGVSLASAAYEEYAGVTGFGNLGAGATGTSRYPEADVMTQDTSSWSVGGLAVATSSGDTFSADLGTIRQSLIPALTTAAIGLIDNTTVPVAVLRNAVLCSASRAWAAIAIELRTGVTATNVTSTNTTVIAHPASGAQHQLVHTPASATVQLFMFAAQLKTGTLNIAYSETITIAGGTSPYTSTVVSGALPTGLSLNSSTAVISGTPSALGTFNFTIKVTDAVGNTASNSFQIIVSSSPGGNSGWIS